MSENGEIYTAAKNFTLPPALTALTNSTSGIIVVALYEKPSKMKSKSLLFKWCKLRIDTKVRPAEMRVGNCLWRDLEFGFVSQQYVTLDAGYGNQSGTKRTKVMK